MPDERELPGSAIDRENWEAADQESTMDDERLQEIEGRSKSFFRDWHVLSGYRKDTDLHNLLVAYRALQKENKGLVDEDRIGWLEQTRAYATTERDNISAEWDELDKKCDILKEENARLLAALEDAKWPEVAIKIAELSWELVDKTIADKLKRMITQLEVFQMKNHNAVIQAAIDAAKKRGWK